MAVVGMFGDVTPYAGEVQPMLVEECERLLEMARSGELQGMAAALLHSDGGGAFRIVGVVGGYSLLGALSVMERRLIEDQR